jgi:hypothetical protein
MASIWLDSFTASFSSVTLDALTFASSTLELALERFIRMNVVSAVAMKPLILLAEHLINPDTVENIGSKTMEFYGSLLFSDLIGI